MKKQVIVPVITIIIVCTLIAVIILLNSRILKIDRTVKHGRTQTIPAIGDNANRHILGLLIPESGSSYKEASEAERMVRFLVDKTNASGGLLGKKIDLMIFDSGKNSIDAIEAANQAIKAGVFAVIGGLFSSQTLAAADILNEAEIPMITPSASHIELTLTRDYVFRVCIDDTIQSNVMARLAIDEFDPDNVLICKNMSNLYSISLSNQIKNSLQGLELNSIAEFGFHDEAFEAKLIIEALEKNRPDVIFMTGYPAHSGILIKRIREHGFDVPIIGGDAFGSYLYEIAGDSLYNVYGTNAWHPQNRPIDTHAYLLEYSKKYGELISALQALTHDAVLVLYKAIADADSFDADPVCQAIRELRGFKGVTADFTFCNNGNPMTGLVVLEYNKKDIKLHSYVEPDYYKVGVIFAKTGPSSRENRVQYTGVQYAMHTINKDNSTVRKTMAVFEYDHKGSPITAKIEAQQAINDGMDAIIGSSWSSHSLAIAPVFQEAGIPMITPMSTNPDVTLVGDYIFRACYIDTQQAAVMAKFAYNNLNARNAVVIQETGNKYSTDLAKFFAQSFLKYPDTVVSSSCEYHSEDTDFANIKKKVIQLKPDIIYMPGYMTRTALIMKQIRTTYDGSIFLGSDSWNASIFELAGTAVENSYYTNFWHRDINSKINQQFISGYESFFGRIIDINIPQAYDAAILLADAVSRSDPVTAAAVRDSIQNTDGFEGVTGSFTFNAKGDPVNKAIIINQFKESESRFVLKKQ